MADRGALAEQEAPETFASYLKGLRVAANLTQDAVAEILDLGQPAVSAYEIGRAYPPGSTLYRLAKLYGADVDELLARLVADEEARGGRKARAKS